METHIVTLKLPEHLLSRASSVAEQQDITIGHLVRDLLSKEVNRRLNPKTPNRADEGVVTALQALLAREMALARNWADLSLRLADAGYELRPMGGGLTVHKRPCGSRLCKASELGFPYRTLVNRFRAGMPGHPHGTLNLVFDRLPSKQEALPLEGDAEFDVIDFDA